MKSKKNDEMMSICLPLIRREATAAGWRRMKSKKKEVTR